MLVGIPTVDPFRDSLRFLQYPQNLEATSGKPWKESMLNQTRKHYSISCYVVMISNCGWVKVVTNNYQVGD